MGGGMGRKGGGGEGGQRVAAGGGGCVRGCKEEEDVCDSSESTHSSRDTAAGLQQCKQLTNDDHFFKCAGHMSNVEGRPLTR